MLGLTVTCALGRRLKLMTSPLLQDWLEFRTTLLDPTTRLPRMSIQEQPSWQGGFFRLLQNKTLICWSTRADVEAGKTPLRSLDLHEVLEALEVTTLSPAIDLHQHPFSRNKLRVRLVHALAALINGPRIRGHPL